VNRRSVAKEERRSHQQARRGKSGGPLRRGPEARPSGMLPPEHPGLFYTAKPAPRGPGKALGSAHCTAKPCPATGFGLSPYQKPETEVTKLSIEQGACVDYHVTRC
jgi:hypothetical protein